MRTLLFGPLLCLAWSQGIVAAQTVTPGSADGIDDIRKNYPIHLKGLHIRPSLLLKELGVDSNVFNEVGDEKSDFFFTLTPRVDLAVPIARRALVKTAVDVDAVYYQRYASERSIDPQVIVRGEVYAHRLTLFAEGAYLNTHQRVNKEIDARVRRLENGVTVGTAVRLTPKFSIEVSARAEETRYADDAVFDGQELKKTLNDDTRIYGVTARHRWTPLTTLSLLYENQEDRFPLSPVRDTDSFRVMPGVDFKPRALVSGSAHVGYRSFQPKSALVPPDAGLVSRLALSYTILGATTLGTTFVRDFIFSYEATDPYFVSETPGVSVRQAVGGRFDVIATAARDTYSYRRLAIPTAPVSTPERVETTETYGLNLGYRLKRQTRVGAGVTYTTRGSVTDPSRGYTGFRFVTTVSSGISR